jgi:rubrerythrin
MFTEFRDSESLEIASVFWDMAVEEKRHSNLLRVCYHERYADSDCPLTEEGLQEFIEVPKLESGDVFEAAETATTSPRERALHVALEAEKSAHDFYTKLVEHTEDHSLRRLYSELSLMEDGHVGYLQNMLAAAAGGGENPVH